MPKFEGRVLPDQWRPVIGVHVELPGTPVDDVFEFLVDTGSPRTILNATLLGIGASTLGPSDPDGVRGISGGNLPAWTVSNGILRIEGTNGMIKDITPSDVIAIDDPKAPNILGCDCLVEHGLKLVFDPAKPEFYLRR